MLRYYQFFMGFTLPAALSARSLMHDACRKRAKKMSKNVEIKLFSVIFLAAETIDFLEKSAIVKLLKTSEGVLKYKVIAEDKKRQYQKPEEGF